MSLSCISCGGDLVKKHDMLGGTLAECEACHMLHVTKTNENGEEEVMQDIATKDLTPERKELLEKLRELQTHHNEVRKAAKAMAKDYRDQLTDIDKELNDTLDALKGQE